MSPIFGGFFDIDRKKQEIAELEARTQLPGFWNDNIEAQKVMQEITTRKEWTEFWEQVDLKTSDFIDLIELAEDGGDKEMDAVLDAELHTIETALGELEFKNMLSGEDDKRNAIISIHSGAGGTESQDWAEMLLRMYIRWAERRGFKKELVDFQPGDEAGIKDATITITGEYAYGLMLAEAGVHRLVRISPYDQAARRHTSFASVFVWPELPDDIDIVVEDKDLRIDTYRSSGAGGQHVNVTDSAVRITHLPTGIVTSCQNERSQHRNKDVAMRVLKSKLYDLRLKEQQATLDRLGGEKKDIAFGSQIRSYVLHPYQMVKDHRTKESVGDVNRILDGDVDGFIKAYLMKKAAGTLSAATDDDV